MFYIDSRDSKFVVLNKQTGRWAFFENNEKLYRDFLLLNEERIDVNSFLLRYESENDNVSVLFEKSKRNIRDDQKIGLIIYDMTDGCNFSCSYCFAKAKSCANVIGWNVIQKTLIQIKNSGLLKDKFRIEFTGGEVLLFFDKFKEIILNLNKLKNEMNLEFEVVIQTNASLVTKEIASFLKYHNILVGVSLDGSRKYNMKRMYRNNTETFDDIVSGIEKLKQEQLGVSVISVISESTQYMDSFSTIKELGINQSRMNIIRNMGNAIDNNLPINEIDYDELGREYIEFAKRVIFEEKDYFLEANLDVLLLSLVQEFPFMCHKRRCGAGKNQIYIDINGDYYLCQEWKSVGAEKVGNCFDDGFELGRALKKNSIYNELNTCKRNNECETCEWNNYCNICPAIRYAEHGNVDGKVNMCNFYKRVYSELLWLMNNEETKLYLLAENKR